MALTVDVACYCPGTLILTDRGEVPIESMAIGDRVITIGDRAEPIRWIGRRSYGARFVAGQPALWPVCIRAGALGGGLPRRDLSVSPKHALLLDGILVPARALVDGARVIHVPAGGGVEYIHLELARHDVIFAEGAAAESFVDDDSRGLFQNAADSLIQYSGSKPVKARFCAEMHEDGVAVDHIRRRLTGSCLVGDERSCA